MKIAVIGAKGLPAKQGGIEHHCAEVYSRLAAQGHTVDFYGRASYTARPWLSQQTVDGVRVISLPSLQLRGLDAFFSSALGAIAAIANRYDIIHFHALGPALFTWLPKIATSAKVVVTCQGLDWQRAKWGQLSSHLIRMGENAAVRCAHEIVVVSKELRTYFLKTYGRETVYIPNGPGKYAVSDPSSPYVKSLGLEPGRYMLFLGRLVPEKRPDLLIESFQRLQSQHWKLVIAGGTSDTDRFYSELQQMAMNNPNIVFTGEIKGSRLAEVVRGAGLFVLPSDLEGLPLAMLEAMREGIPVLASDIPAHRQLVGEGRGILFQAGNVESCLQQLSWAIQNQQALAAMAKNARHHVQTEYDWKRITNDLLEVYTTLLEPIPSDEPVDQQLAPGSQRAALASSSVNWEKRR
jgi:glycosyltransferase involved in cell wall biosynthesis